MKLSLCWFAWSTASSVTHQPICLLRLCSTMISPNSTCKLRAVSGNTPNWRAANGRNWSNSIGPRSVRDWLGQRQARGPSILLSSMIGCPQGVGIPSSHWRRARLLGQPLRSYASLVGAFAGPNWGEPQTVTDWGIWFYPFLLAFIVFRVILPVIDLINANSFAYEKVANHKKCHKKLPFWGNGGQRHFRLGSLLQVGLLWLVLFWHRGEQHQTIQDTSDEWRYCTVLYWIFSDHSHQKVFWQCHATFSEKLASTMKAWKSGVLRWFDYWWMGLDMMIVSI